MVGTAILTQTIAIKGWSIMASLVPVALVEEDAKRQGEVVCTPNHAYNSFQCDESRPVSQPDFVPVYNVCPAGV